MKRILFLMTFVFSVSLFAEYKTASQTLYIQNFQSPSVTSLLSSPLTLTTSWQNIGDASLQEQSLAGNSSVALWTNLDINDSNNARIRALAFHTTGGASYLLPIKTVSSSDIKIESEYFEFNSDSDQKAILTWDLDRVVPYVIFQAQVSSVGSTAAQVDDAYITKGWR